MAFGEGRLLGPLLPIFLFPRATFHSVAEFCVLDLNVIFTPLAAEEQRIGQEHGPQKDFFH